MAGTAYEFFNIPASLRSRLLLLLPLNLTPPGCRHKPSERPKTVSRRPRTRQTRLTGEGGVTAANLRALVDLELNGGEILVPYEILLLIWPLENQCATSLALKHVSPFLPTLTRGLVNFVAAAATDGRGRIIHAFLPLFFCASSKVGRRREFPMATSNTLPIPRNLHDPHNRRSFHSAKIRERRKSLSPIVRRRRPENCYRVLGRRVVG